MASWQFIALCGVIALIAVAAAAYGLGLKFSEAKVEDNRSPLHTPGTHPLPPSPEFDPATAAKNTPRDGRQKEREVIEAILPQFNTGTNAGIRGLIDKLEYFESAASYIQMGRQPDFVMYGRQLLELYKGTQQELANFRQQNRLYADVADMIQFPNANDLERIMLATLERAEDFGPQGKAKNTERLFLDLKGQMQNALMAYDQWRSKTEEHLIALHRELAK